MCLRLKEIGTLPEVTDLKLKIDLLLTDGNSLYIVKSINHDNGRIYVDVKNLRTGDVTAVYVTDSSFIVVEVEVTPEKENIFETLRLLGALKHGHAYEFFDILPDSSFDKLKMLGKDELIDLIRELNCVMCDSTENWEGG